MRHHQRIINSIDIRVHAKWIGRNSIKRVNIHNYYLIIKYVETFNILLIELSFLFRPHHAYIRLLFIDTESNSAWTRWVT